MHDKAPQAPKCLQRFNVDRHHTAADPAVVPWFMQPSPAGMLIALRVGAGLLALLALFTLRGKRWAYPAFVLLGLLYIPAQTGFHIHPLPPKCDLATTLTTRLLLLSLRDYARIGLFAAFAWMSWVQFRWTSPRFVWTVLATLLAGALVAIAEGMTAQGHCRVRDLVPAAAAGMGAALLLAFWSRLRRKPGYVRIVKPGTAAAPRHTPVPPRPVAPPPPVDPQPGWVSPPPDFSPGPTATTEKVEPREAVAAVSTQAKVMRLLHAILQQLRAIVRGAWGLLRRRRRMIVAVVLLALVGAAAAVFLLLQTPAPVAVEQPEAPPPPPHPLQADAEGYYEPSYEFSVSDRRFTRLTLRPEPFIRFERIGTHQEAGCENSVVRPDVVRLHCELDRVGTVTIDGRFLTRFTTARLDAPVLSAWVEVRNLRGEVVYRARDSFRWHAPDDSYSSP